MSGRGVSGRGGHSDCRDVYMIAGWASMPGITWRPSQAGERVTYLIAKRKRSRYTTVWSRVLEWTARSITGAVGAGRLRPGLLR